MLAPELDVSLEIAYFTNDTELDGNSLIEILSNLLDNARRHAVRAIWVGVRVERATLHVRVTDDGSGVPEPAVGRIFDRFASLDGKGGSGLGLAIARSLAQAAGGDLTYSRDSGGGASFLVTLPVRSRVPEHVAARS